MKKYKVEFVEVVINKYEVEVYANNEFEAQDKVEADFDEIKLYEFSDIVNSYTDHSEVTDVKEIK